MGFGRDLGNSHDGLLKLQDWELKLLETVKRFMTLRVKSDKEYASLLLNISQQVEKHDNSSQMDYISNVSKVNTNTSIQKYRYIHVYSTDTSVNTDYICNVFKVR